MSRVNLGLVGGEGEIVAGDQRGVEGTRGSWMNERMKDRLKNKRN